MKFTVIVYGEPIAQGRPRFNRNSGRAYDPEKSRDYKDYVRLFASRNRPYVPVEGPVRFSLVIYRQIPKSFSKRKIELAVDGHIRPTTKPDVSNVLKGVEDALKGIWYKDDSQIVEFGRLAKFYSVNPRIEIEMEELA